MGVAGVAWATFLCQGVSCVLALIFVFLRLKKIKSDKKAPVFSFSVLKTVSKIAVPSILQQSFISVGNIFIQGLINGFGSGTIAGYSAAIKLNNMVITSLTTLANGISNFTAQNLGAKEYNRISEGFKAGIKLVCIICVPVIAAYLILSRPLVSIFLEDASGEAMSVGRMFLTVVSPFYFVVAVKLVSDGVLRGAGQMKLFMAATFTDLLLRVVLAAILSSTALGSTGIWLSWPIGWIISTVLSVLFYRSWIKSGVTEYEPEFDAE